MKNHTVEIPGSQNKRKYQRIKFKGLANIQTNENYSNCLRIKNLSLTGMFVAGKLQGSRAKKCQIKIFHSDLAGNNSLQLYARIVRKDDDGLGLVFTGMTFDNYLLLHRLLVNESPDPYSTISELPAGNPPYTILPR